MLNIYYDGLGAQARVQTVFMLPDDLARRLWDESIRGPDQRCYAADDIRDAVVAMLRSRAESRGDTDGGKVP